MAVEVHRLKTNPITRSSSGPASTSMPTSDRVQTTAQVVNNGIDLANYHLIGQPSMRLMEGQSEVGPNIGQLRAAAMEKTIQLTNIAHKLAQEHVDYLRANNLIQGRNPKILRRQIETYLYTLFQNKPTDSIDRDGNFELDQLQTLAQSVRNRVAEDTIENAGELSLSDRAKIIRNGIAVFASHREVREDILRDSGLSEQDVNKLVSTALKSGALNVALKFVKGPLTSMAGAATGFLVIGPQLQEYSDQWDSDVVDAVLNIGVVASTAGSFWAQRLQAKGASKMVEHGIETTPAVLSAISQRLLQQVTSKEEWKEAEKISANMYFADLSLWIEEGIFALSILEGKRGKAAYISANALSMASNVLLYLIAEGAILSKKLSEKHGDKLESIDQRLGDYRAQLSVAMIYVGDMLSQLKDKAAENNVVRKLVPGIDNKGEQEPIPEIQQIQRLLLAFEPVKARKLTPQKRKTENPYALIMDSKAANNTI